MGLIERLLDEASTEKLTLDQVKAWLKVEHELDNATLENLKEVAIYEAYNFMQNDFEEINEEGDLVDIPIPFNVKICALMFIAYLYENRGDLPTQLPLNCMRLLNPYKKLVGT